MKSFLKIAVGAAILALGSALPGMAQIDNSVNFTTSFPFYAEKAQLPAGSYKITPADVDAHALIVQSMDGKYSSRVQFIPMHSEQPHQQYAVTFQKYGDTEYLDRIWVEGQQYGMKVDPTKAELNTA